MSYPPLARAQYIEHTNQLSFASAVYATKGKAVYAVYVVCMLHAYILHGYAYYTGNGSTHES